MDNKTNVLNNGGVSTINQMNMNVAMDTVQQTKDLKDKREQLDAAMNNDKMFKAIEKYKRAHTPLMKEYHIGRNDLCPCGSGKKYKHCCLKTGTYENYKLMSKSK